MVETTAICVGHRERIVILLISAVPLKGDLTHFSTLSAVETAGYSQPSRCAGLDRFILNLCRRSVSLAAQSFLPVDSRE